MPETRAFRKIKELWIKGRKVTYEEVL